MLPLNSSTLYFQIYIYVLYFFHYTKSFLRTGILSFSLQYALGHRESSIYEGIKGYLLEENVNRNIGGLWVDGWMDGCHEPCFGGVQQCKYHIHLIL